MQRLVILRTVAELINQTVTVHMRGATVQYRIIGFSGDIIRFKSSQQNISSLPYAEFQNLLADGTITLDSAAKSAA
jgi:hypothetical protein